MDEQTKKRLLQRVASTVGHLKGIERMIENDTYCIDTIRQIQAVQAALHKVNGLILEQHLHHCATTAIRGDDPDDRERVLKEINSVFSFTNKL